MKSNFDQNPNLKSNLGQTLDELLADTALETANARKTIKQLRQMIPHAPKLVSFKKALSSGTCLIAEVKEKSPSRGSMLTENVKDAPSAYKESRVVKAISVLTNTKHFGSGMSLARMRQIKLVTGKPVLRKDFITTELQVVQARAYGADAILLMANILNKDGLKKLSDVAHDYGMDVLFETHCPSELNDLPETADLIGINCRNFKPSTFSGFWMAKQVRWLGAGDTSTDLERFRYVNEIPSRAVKIAESGISPENCHEVFEMGFHTALVGTSLLMDRRGIVKALNDFEEAILAKKQHRVLPQQLERSSLSPSMAQLSLPSRG